MSAPDRCKRFWSGASSEAALPNRPKQSRPNYEDEASGHGHKQDCSPRPLSHNDYNVGWVCALHIEMAAAKAMLDNVHDESLFHASNDSNDSNTYVLGSIGKHNVVIACLPSGGYGTNNAATVANDMQRSFPSINIRLMVGIGGGVPGTVDVRLGDIVVGEGVIQHDKGKTHPHGRFERTGITTRPPQGILTAVSTLRANHQMSRTKIPSILSKMLELYPEMQNYSRHGQCQDWLFQNTYDHAQSLSNCNQCDQSRLVDRPDRNSTDPNIHYGIIASGNQVMKDAKTRDKVAEDLNALCFEMEAAGLDNFPCLVIRGICDYSDSHKNKQWQEYAAATAAAYAKELLAVMSSKATPKGQRQVSGTQTAAGQPSLSHSRKDLLDSLRFSEIESRQANIKAAHAKTCRWFLKHPDYINWLDPSQLSQHHGFLWISGKPGAGKSTLMKYIYTCAKKKAAGNAATIAFFFNARGDDLEKSTVGMHRSLLLQLFEKLPDLQEVLDDPDYAPQNRSGSLTWEIDALQGLFSRAVARLGDRRLTCFVDALDEGDESQVIAMVRHFEDLADQAVLNRLQLHICFSSRHYPYIDIRTGCKLTLEDQDGHGQDLDSYIQSSLRAGKGKQAEEVKAGILQKAAGVFIWVVLVVEILNEEFRRGRIFAVRKRLREIPAELSELFKDMLQRDQINMDNFLLCIQWILYARRPLKREEFYYAVVSGLDLEPEDLAEWNPELITMDDLQRFVLSSSKGLAEIAKSNTVQFIHESVRDFLIKDNGLRNLWPTLGPEPQDFESLSHDRLKQCCLTFTKVDISIHLSFSEPLPKANTDKAKSLRRGISEKFPFLEYSTNHVLYHADAAAKNFPQDEFVKQFPLGSLPTWINLRNLFEKFEIRRYTSDANFLYILADNNLARLIRMRLRHDPSIDVQGERHRYPLFAALVNGHQDAAEALLPLERSFSQEDDISTQLEHEQNVALHKDQMPRPRVLEGGHFGHAKFSSKYRKLSINWKDREGRTALSLAVQRSWDTVVKQLLAFERINVNSRDNHGKTPLLLAAEEGQQAIVKLLLATEGVDLTLEDSNGRTPLLSAHRNGHEATVRLLLEVERFDVESKDDSEWTPLPWAAGAVHRVAVRLLLGVNGVDVERKDSEGRTILSWAAGGGYTTLVRLLLAMKGIDVNSKDNRGQTPLLWAAMVNHEDIVRLLLEVEGIDVNSKDDLGQTPLSWAAEWGHEGTVRLLLEVEGIDVNSKDELGKTPLSWAARANHEDIVRLLLEVEGIDVNSKDDLGQTPLLWAAEWGHEGTMRLLLEVEGIDVNSKDNRGRTPLFWASTHQKGDIVRLLLEVEGINVESKDNRGQTPLSWAAEWGHEGIVRLLLEVEGIDVNSKDNRGWTPLFWASMNWKGGIVRLLLEVEGIDIESKDDRGRTLLSWAAEWGHEGIIRLLLDSEGIDVNSKDNRGWTPLSWAAEWGHEGIMRLLLEVEGIDVNWRNNRGQTPLLLAAANKHEYAVRLLLATEGIDVSCADERGRSPLWWATQKGHEAIVKMLQK